MTIKSYLINGIFSDLFSSLTAGTRRLKTEQGSSALEEGRVFKINHRFVGIGSTEQLVFKVNLAKDTKVIVRHIDLWEGGLEYFGIPDTGQYPTVDPLLTETAIIYPLNNTVSSSSTMTGTYGVLNGADVIPIADTDQFSITDLCLTGSSNSAASSDSTDETLSIQPAGSSFYLVFNHLGAGNETSSGHYELIFEEI